MTNVKKVIITIIAAVFLCSVFVASASATPTTSAKPMMKEGTHVGSAYDSLNWSGYAQYSSSSTYGSLTGKWVVPTLSTTASGYSSAWIGIGGFSGDTVIQIGTEQDCLTGHEVAGKRFHGPEHAFDQKFTTIDPSKTKSSSSCTPTYYAWYELYPENAEQQISSFTVKAGDSISTSITDTAGSWTLSITDSTSGKTFTTTQKPTFTPDQTSAEAIMERPEVCSTFSCSLTDLADFGTAGYTGITSTSLLSSTNSNSITMVDNSDKTMASPTAITTPGNFNVAWVKNN